MLALLPLLAGLIPEVAKLLAGDKVGAVAGQVVGIAQTVLGTDDPVQAAVALQDPEKLGAIRIRLQEIASQREAAARQAELDTLRASLADTANARQQTTTLAASGSPIAWGAPVVSLVIVLGFFGSFCMLLLRGYAPDPGTAAMLNIMIGALAAGFAAVSAYWLGSSAGSARKTDILADRGQLQQQSPPIATTGDVTVNNPGPSAPGTTADDLNAQELARPRIRVQAKSSADSETWTPSR